MKTTLRTLSLLLALLLLVFSFVACNGDTGNGGNTDGGNSGNSDTGNSDTGNSDTGNGDTGNGENTDGEENNATPSLWDGATYKESKSFGEGTHTLSITVKMEDKSIVLTIKTDAATVKDALAAHNLIDGEQQAIGYMMSTLNGVRADWNLDGAYWAFYQNGDYMMTGIDQTPVAGNAAYEFVYTPAS